MQLRKRFEVLSRKKKRSEKFQKPDDIPGFVNNLADE